MLGRRVLRCGRKTALERLADDHPHQRVERVAGRLWGDLGRVEERREHARGRLGALLLGVVEDLRLEVVERLGVPAVQRLVAALAQEEGRVLGGAFHAVAVQNLDGDLRGRRRIGGGLGRLFADRRARGLLAGVRIRGHELLDDALDLALGRDELEVRVRLEVLETRLEEVAARQLVDEPAEREQRVEVDLLLAARADGDRLGDRRDDRGQLRDVRTRRELLLHALHERLLARVAEEVVVGVAEAHERERLAAAEPLVAGLEVDGRVVLAEARVVVEVAPVDVQEDAVQVVHGLDEPGEVDRDVVVDVDAGELVDGLDRTLDAAVGVGLVDLGRARRVPLAADRGDQQVARERQHRDRLLLRIDADEHQRVRAGVQLVPVALAPVVADEQCDRRLVQLGDVGECRERLDLGLRLRRDERDRVLAPEPGAAGEPADQHEHPDDHPQEDPPDRHSDAAPRRAVTGHLRERHRRNGGRAVRRRATHASLERRPHGKNRREAMGRG